MVLTQPKRVLEEIRYKVLKRPVDYASLIFYVVASGLMYLLYSSKINKPTPTVGGLSLAYFYSLIIWIVIMISVFFAVATSWK